MKIITSRSNHLIKHVCTLHSKSGRYTHGEFIAEGLRTIQALIESKNTLVTLYILQGLPADITYDQSRITFVTPEVMAKISTTKTPSGYLAVFKMPPQPLPELRQGIVLANISDPGNMGTLIRTAAAMNMHDVVIVEGCDPWSPKVVQATAGTIGAVTMHQYSWRELITIKKEKKLCALVVSNGKPLESVIDQDLLLVVGNEAHGIPQEWLNDCELRGTIAMPGNTESLNAAVAGSIALYILSQH